MFISALSGINYSRVNFGTKIIEGSNLLFKSRTEMQQVKIINGQPDEKSLSAKRSLSARNYQTEYDQLIKNKANDTLELKIAEVDYAGMKLKEVTATLTPEKGKKAVTIQQFFPFYPNLKNIYELAAVKLKWKK